VPGVFGNAWRAEPDDATSYLDATTSGLSHGSYVINPSAGTIEFWARLEGFGGTIDLAPIPGLMATVPLHPVGAVPPGTWILAFTSNDGGGNGGLVGQVGDVNTTGTDAFGQGTTYEDILGPDVEGWHHYAISWRETGFAMLGQPDREVMLFVDGAPVSTHWEEAVLRGFDANGAPIFGSAALVPPLGAELVLGVDGPGQEWPPGTAVEFDNLKVWNVAKTDFSDRFDESSLVWL
jgi:hypothetical protein